MRESQWDSLESPGYVPSQSWRVPCFHASQFHPALQYLHVGIHTHGFTRLGADGLLGDNESLLPIMASQLLSHFVLKLMTYPYWNTPPMGARHKESHALYLYLLFRFYNAKCPRAFIASSFWNAAIQKCNKDGEEYERRKFGLVPYSWTWEKGGHFPMKAIVSQAGVSKVLGICLPSRC